MPNMKAMPLFVDPGQVFTSTAATQLNLAAKGLNVKMGPSFSFYAKVKYTKINPWARIFDFGNAGDKGNIVSGIIPPEMSGLPPDQAMLMFEYHPENPEAAVIQLHSHDLRVKIGEEHAYLFTIDEKGRMCIWADGYMIVEKSGIPVEQAYRPFLLIGDANFNHPGFSKDGPFEGEIKDVRVFNASVTWSSVSTDQEAIVWPGLENGMFALRNEQGLGGTNTYMEKPPFGWMGQGSVIMATAGGVKDLGGPKPEDDSQLYCMLQDSGAGIKQWVRYLTSGAQYWVAFLASAGQGTDSLLTVSVDGQEYVTGADYDNTEFSTQWFSFVSTRPDGKALLEFKNDSPSLGKGATKLFIGNIRISDAPACYKRFKAQSKCIHEKGTHGTKYASGATEAACRKFCEDMRCTFMLFDPVSFKGESTCEIYPDCNMMSTYYGGETGQLYSRVPCAAGGFMAPEVAQFYRMPAGARMQTQIPANMASTVASIIPEKDVKEKPAALTEIGEESDAMGALSQEEQEEEEQASWT